VGPLPCVSAVCAAFASVREPVLRRRGGTLLRRYEWL